MGFFGRIGNFFRNVGRGIWNGIKTVGRGIWNGVKNIGKRVGQFVGIIPKDPEPEEQALLYNSLNLHHSLVGNQIQHLNRI
ncbi:hypothetical protein TVAGG3_0915580, partial [Trichomonas vaginalis G3]|uniref:hypothetical protein n=1 Tax=Trichomonas vaginalis (strain ATCC PRA-98 / G3) TaxID=412133 RepID=UPI0021E60AA1